MRSSAAIKFGKAIAIGLLIAIILLVAAYGRIEYLTYRYGDQFKVAARKTSWEGELMYLRVFSYSEKDAKVFIVERQQSYEGQDQETYYRTGTFYYFGRGATSSAWSLQHWEVVWSEAGSADGWTMPPYM